MDCVFCKIAEGEIPSATIYEDKDFRVVLDIGPASFGHALVLPKRHYANIYELPEEIVSSAFVLAKKTAVAIKEGLHADGMNILQNNGEQAGQSVFHFHIHVIPRYQGDQVGLVWTPGNLDENDKKEIIQKVRQFM
ncbi:HIT family protein [Blautia liquoris]|uniref:HIT family protein n=1 Tax=Blautia liquoris TaxID=2779518 RepID=A0A7M2RH99_9FIRM|nr:HIT family protein [Blautia liquoris]QOV19498.1 HIT family protein [Blautia liquoris]